MGAFKNQLIADQVEVGDRVPKPMPWYSHASLTRRAVRVQQKQMKLQKRVFYISMWGMWLIGLATGIMMWILVEVFA